MFLLTSIYDVSLTPILLNTSDFIWLTVMTLNLTSGNFEWLVEFGVRNLNTVYDTDINDDGLYRKECTTIRLLGIFISICCKYNML